MADLQVQSATELSVGYLSGTEPGSTFPHRQGVAATAPALPTTRLLTARQCSSLLAQEHREQAHAEQQGGLARGRPEDCELIKTRRQQFEASA